MNKIFYLFLLTFLIAGCATNSTSTNNQGIDSGDDDFYCEDNIDCEPFVYECGNCADYSIAINRQSLSKYQDLYSKKCKDKLRMCDALPSGYSKCENNKCILIK